MKPAMLGVNIDHVATLRQARGTDYPSVVEAARVVEAHGADLVTVHLREDRRHIQDADVTALLGVVETRLNLEMAATEEMIEFALTHRPSDVCIVPERREELTTEGGLDVAGQSDWIAECCRRLGGAGIRVSLFIDPEAVQVRAARACGAPVVELHTGVYAEAGGAAGELSRISEAARVGLAEGLVVNAGHGLTLDNLGAVAGLGAIAEFNIGHALVSRALFTGLGRAVEEFREVLAGRV
ncbi:MAG: pyridoxine 5'-phosphate synthase [Wenzhouxiangellaceae bacterium]|nr:pyridoxine 5'-phosphate synthase [Wenzhouxiangellaceae bacterium]